VFFRQFFFLPVFPRMIEALWRFQNTCCLQQRLFPIATLLMLAQCAIRPTPTWSQGEPAPVLTREQVDRIGQRIWENECAGKVEGLTSWNAGEDFASLGIGHFIWYPAGKRGPFEESFPRLIQYLARSGVQTPAWAVGPCPWQDRAAFLANQNDARLRELRQLLSTTIRQQTEFIMARSRAALPKMLAAAGSSADTVRHNYMALSATPEGAFALIDYVNFKGEGTAAGERYRGQGWGLLQVLETMPISSPAQAPAAFADAASAVLSRRVENAPPERNEARWLPGWRNRCQSYKKPL